MGTRADFYVGKGQDAEWVGSIAYDGYGPSEKPNCALMQSSSEEEFRAAVKGILGIGHIGPTTPEQGWPWAWKTSANTDFQYWFDTDQKKVYWGTWGREGEGESRSSIDWPDMSDVQRVTTGPRSGFTVLGF